MKEPIHTHRRGPILTVTLNRPEKRNALTAPMLDELLAIFQTVGEEEEVRVLVLNGAGKAFCAGLDLAEMASHKAETGSVGLTPLQGVFRALETVPQPTIAMVRGAAIAGGCELALHCDLRVAAGDAEFVMPLARLGIALPLPLVQKLIDSIGTAATSELLFTGEKLDAERALALGMINRLVSGERLEIATLELAERIAANAPLSVRALKRTIFRANEFRRTIAHDDLDEEVTRVAASDDVAEGVAAMRERRPPNFRGR